MNPKERAILHHRLDKSFGTRNSARLITPETERVFRDIALAQKLRLEELQDETYGNSRTDKLITKEFENQELRDLAAKVQGRESLLLQVAFDESQARRAADARADQAILDLETTRAEIAAARRQGYEQGATYVSKTVIEPIQRRAAMPKVSTFTIIQNKTGELGTKFQSSIQELVHNVSLLAPAIAFNTAASILGRIGSFVSNQVNRLMETIVSKIRI